MIICKSPEEIEKIRQASRIVAETLRALGEKVEPGVTTWELNLVAEKHIKKRRAVPAFKGYRGFPASTCISVNEAVVHGIPSKEKVLRSGDIVGVDVGVKYKGYFGDAAVTWPVGEVSSETRRLLETTKMALEAGISFCRSGQRLGDVSHAIQKTAESASFSVVREFVGHGIGESMHEDPQIPNYGLPNRGSYLEEGMVFALEPMVNMGASEVRVLNDNWTVVTADGSLSAHFEHTVAISKDGPLILTVL